MKIFYSKTGQGFYSDEVHGPRLLLIADPAWTHPVDLAGTPEPDAVAPQIEVANPKCKIPPDAVEITAEAHAALLAGQAGGKMIAIDSKGNPVLQDRPAPPFAQSKLAELAAYRADRGKMLDCLSGLAGRFDRAGDAASALACDALSQGLLDLPAFPTVAAAQDLPALKAAMKARYNTLLAAVPAPVMAAYKGVLA